MYKVLFLSCGLGAYIQRLRYYAKSGRLEPVVLPVYKRSNSTYWKPPMGAPQTSMMKNIEDDINQNMYCLVIPYNTIFADRRAEKFCFQRT